MLGGRRLILAHARGAVVLHAEQAELAVVRVIESFEAPEAYLAEGVFLFLWNQVSLVKFAIL